MTNTVKIVAYPRLTNSSRPDVSELVLSIARRYGRKTRGFWSGTPGVDCECSSDGQATTQAFALPDGLANRLISLIEATKRNCVW